MIRSMCIATLRFVLVFALASCGSKSSIHSFEELTKYINESDNGLFKTKTVGLMNYKLKFLPIDYLVLKQMDNTEYGDVKKQDSLRRAFSNSLTFMFTVEPKAGEDFDVTRYNASNYEEFARTIEQMCFEAKEWIFIQDQNGKQYKPSIVQLENINSLERGRNFIVVFDDPNLAKGNFSFVYKDELFNTGINKFLFNSKDINQIPKISLSV